MYFVPQIVIICVYKCLLLNQELLETKDCHSFVPLGIKIGYIVADQNNK